MKKLKSLLSVIGGIIICIIFYPIYVIKRFYYIIIDWDEFQDFMEDVFNSISNIKFNFEHMMIRKKTRTKIRNQYLDIAKKEQEKGNISKDDFYTFYNVLKQTDYVRCNPKIFK